MRKPAASGFDNEHVVDDEWQEIAMRRAPRIGRFIALGIGAGFVLALVFTTIAVLSGDGAPRAGLSGLLLTFAIFALIFIAAGLLVSGLLVLVLDRLARRAATKSIADKRTVLIHDLSRPVTDDPPRSDR